MIIGCCFVVSLTNHSGNRRANSSPFQVTKLRSPAKSAIISYRTHVPWPPFHPQNPIWMPPAELNSKALRREDPRVEKVHTGFKLKSHEHFATWIIRDCSLRAEEMSRRSGSETDPAKSVPERDRRDSREKNDLPKLRTFYKRGKTGLNPPNGWWDLPRIFSVKFNRIVFNFSPKPTFQLSSGKVVYFTHWRKAIKSQKKI